jgi:uncharacterized protein
MARALRRPEPTRQKAEGKSQKRRARIPLLAFYVLCSWLEPSFALAPVAAAAQPPPPALTAPVNDFAHVIDPESARELDRRIRALQQKTGDVVVVATVPTFKPYADIREYAVKMFENGGRGIGERGKENGVLIVLAVEDRKVDIEVGYGLEEYITDSYAGDTIREIMAPEFRNGNFGRGLLAGATRLIGRIASARGVTLTEVPAERVPVAPSVQFPGWLPILLVWLVIMLLSNRRKRRRRFWGGGPWSGWSSGVGPFGGGGGGGFGGGFGGFGGGGGGGGFGGFGGGRSGGGGAAGGW